MLTSPRPLAYLVIAMIFMVSTVPFFCSRSDYSPTLLRDTPPSWKHLFGTDTSGRDLLYRVLTGAQISLFVGLSGATISIFIGTLYGMIAGYLGGWWDMIMMRLLDILYSIPRLIFVLIFISIFNTRLQEIANQLHFSWLIPSSRIMILVLTLGFIEWLTVARIIRGQVLSLKQCNYIAAARVLGERSLTLLWNHFLPNLLGFLLVYMTLATPAVIIDEAFLSFLGFGIQAPEASLGSLLAEGTASINPLHGDWWILLFPAITLFLILLILHQFGRSLRAAESCR